MHDVRPGLKTGEVLLPQTFTIQAKNAKGEDITESGAPFQVYVALTGKPKAKKKKAKPEPTEEDYEDD